MRRFLRPGLAIPVLGLLAGVLGPAAPATAAVNLSINDVSQVETNAGTTTFQFTITETNTDGMNPSGAYGYSIQTADNTAVAGGSQPNNDYVANSAGVGVAAPGLAAGASNNRTFNVTVNGDTTYELNDQFFVNLSAATGAATIVDGQGVGTIQNDDNRPNLIFNDPANKLEGNAGTSNYNFPLSLSNATYLAVAVNATTIGGSATSAPAGPGNPDYTEILDQQFTIPAGSTSVNIPVSVNGDTTFEGDETLGVRITNVTNTFTAVDPLSGGVAQANGVIQNDDTAPTASFTPVNANVCEATLDPLNPSQQLIQVNLSAPSGLPGTVTLNLGGTAILNTDYILSLQGGGALVNGSTITFAPGETQKVIVITPIDDSFVEGNETVVLALTAGTGVSGITGGNSVTNILDDESLTVTLEELPNADPLNDPFVIGLNGRPLRCFRATVLDNCGNPVIGTIVTFSIEGNTGGQIVGQGFNIINQNTIQVVTNDQGQAEFCYVPQFPGEDVVTASVEDAEFGIVFSNDVFVEVDAPFNTGNAVVTGSGYVDLAEVLAGLLPGPTGVPSFFSLDVKNGRNNRTVGSVNTTLGVALPIGKGGRWVGGTVNLRSIRLGVFNGLGGLIAGQATTGGKRAIIFGTARVQIQAGRTRFVLNNVPFRVDALDNGNPGVPNDRFQLTLLIDTLVSGGPKSLGRAVRDAGTVPVPSDVFTLTFGGNLDFARTRGVKNNIDIRNGFIVPPTIDMRD